MATKKKLVSKAKAPAKKTVAKKAPVKKTAKPAPKKAVAKAKTSTSSATAKKTISKAKLVVKKVVKVAVKKAVAKKVAPKKVAKPIVKKNTKPAPKKVVAKKIAKAKPVTSKASVTKKIVKVAPKKVAKATKNVAKLVAKKVAPKKNIITPVAKKVASTSRASVTSSIAKTKAIEVKTVAVAPTVKVKAVKPTKPAKVVPVKKPMVAPTTFSNPRVQEVAKNSKEPKGKFEMEFVIRASEDMVFEYVSTESGLSEWFCDDVNIKDSVFTFNWDGQIQEASLVKEIPPLLIRFQWLDKNDGSYFEFRTQKDDLTNDVSLIITDFADSKAEEESARLLWHSQIDKLLHVLGSYF